MGRYYLKSHEWISIESNTATMGISEHAQSELGDIMFIELPKIGYSTKQGEEACVIESMKAASPVNAPLSGTVSEVNGSLTGSPEKLNTSPYEDGWIAKISDFNTDELSELMNEEEYEHYLLNQ